MSQRVDPLLLMGRLLVQAGVLTEERLRVVLLNQIGHRALRWPGKSLGHHLVAGNVVDGDVLEALLDARDAQPVAVEESRLGEIAVRNGFLTREKLAACLAEQEADRRRGSTPLRLGKIMLRDRLMGEHNLQALLDRQRVLLEAAEKAAQEEKEVENREPSACSVGESLEMPAEAA